MAERQPEQAKHIRVTCDSCGKAYRVSSQSIGRKAKCRCGHIFVMIKPQVQTDLVGKKVVLESKSNIVKAAESESRLKLDTNGGSDDGAQTIKSKRGIPDGVVGFAVVLLGGFGRILLYSYPAKDR